MKLIEQKVEGSEETYTFTYMPVFNYLAFAIGFAFVIPSVPLRYAQFFASGIGLIFLGIYSREATRLKEQGAEESGSRFRVNDPPRYTIKHEVDQTAGDV